MSEYNSLPDIWKEHPESVVCVLLHMFTCSPLEVVAGMDDERFKNLVGRLKAWSIIPSKPAIIVISWLISIEWRCGLIDQHFIVAACTRRESIIFEKQLLLYLKVRSGPFRIAVLRSIPNVHGVPIYALDCWSVPSRHSCYLRWGINIFRSAYIKFCL
jgi:hypothetical protein